MSFFTRMLTQSHTSDAPIAPQPRLTSLRSMRMLLLIFTVIMLVLPVSDMLIGIVTLREVSFPWQVLSLPFMYLCIIGCPFGRNSGGNASKHCAWLLLREMIVCSRMTNHNQILRH